MRVEKISNFLAQKSQLLLWLMMAVYFIVFSSISIWKYYNFGYNGLDLAIFNQTFYNSSQGNLFGLTIHPHSYLGDHFEMIIILLLPFYYLWQHPINLLILQSLILSLCAWPLYLIAKKFLPKPWLFLVGLIWLLNPFVQNINIFEFHILPFAIFLILWCFYFYQQKNFPAFLVLAGLSLLVREDVPLVIFMFSILALISKRTKKWIIWPALISSAWFVFATLMISYFTPTGSYKFLYYYSWLGGSLGEMVNNLLANPLLLFSRFFVLNNLIFVLALLLPFAFIFFDVKFLLLGILIFLQLSLGGANNQTIVLKTHYSSLMLPALFIAYLAGLGKMFLMSEKLSKLKRFLVKERPLFIAIILMAVVYSAVYLGPLPTAIKFLFKSVYSKELRRIKTDFYQSLPNTSKVAASYEFLTNLSGRKDIYSLHYVYIGKKQFSDIDYQLPADTQTLLFDFNDLLTYNVQFPYSQQWQEYYLQGDNNFRQLINEGNYQPTLVADALVRLDKNAQTDLKLYEVNPPIQNIEHVNKIAFNNGLVFLGWSTNLPPTNRSESYLPLAFYFQATEKIEKDYQLKLLFKNKNGQIVHQQYYPLAYGLYPTSEWQKNEVVKINYWFLIPQKISKLNYQVELQVVQLEGFLRLNGLRSAVAEITNEKILEPTIYLPRPIGRYNLPLAQLP